MITLSEVKQSVAVTTSDLLNLINTNSIQVGQNYLITDTTQADEGILVQGVTSNSISLDGCGVYLNADYNGNGDYSSVPTYSGINRGAWVSNLPSVNIGDVVIYDNRNYINLTGSIGTAPNSDTTNWQLLSKSITTGYIREIDFVTYYFSTDQLLSRKDRRNNYIEYAFTGVAINVNPIYSFQWGNDFNFQNTIIGRSVFDATNSRNKFFYNTLNNGQYISIVEYSAGFNGEFSYNVIEEFGYVELASNCYGSVTSNYIKGGKPGALVLKDISNTSSVYFNTINLGDVLIDKMLGNSSFFNNNISDGGAVKIVEMTTIGKFTENEILSCDFRVLTQLDATYKKNSLFSHYVFYDTISKQIEGDTLLGENSSLTIELDMNDPAIYNVATNQLKIPSNYLAFGNINLANCSGKTIKSIILLGTYVNVLRRFYPESGSTVTFENITVSSVFLGSLLCDAGTSLNPLTGRPVGTDFIEYKLTGDISNYAQLRTNLVLLS